MQPRSTPPQLGARGRSASAALPAARHLLTPVNSEALRGLSEAQAVDAEPQTPSPTAPAPPAGRRRASSAAAAMRHQRRRSAGAALGVLPDSGARAAATWPPSPQACAPTSDISAAALQLVEERQLLSEALGALSAQLRGKSTVRADRVVDVLDALRVKFCGDVLEPAEAQPAVGDVPTYEGWLEAMVFSGGVFSRGERCWGALDAQGVLRLVRRNSNPPESSSVWSSLLSAVQEEGREELVTAVDGSYTQPVAGTPDAFDLLHCLSRERFRLVADSGEARSHWMRALDAAGCVKPILLRDRALRTHTLGAAGELLAALPVTLPVRWLRRVLKRLDPEAAAPQSRVALDQLARDTTRDRVVVNGVTHSGADGLGPILVHLAGELLELCGGRDRLEAACAAFATRLLLASARTQVGGDIFDAVRLVFGARDLLLRPLSEQAGAVELTVAPASDARLTVHMAASLSFEALWMGPGHEGASLGEVVGNYRAVVTAPRSLRKFEEDATMFATVTLSSSGASDGLGGLGGSGASGGASERGQGSGGESEGGGSEGGGSEGEAEEEPEAEAPAVQVSGAFAAM